MYTEIITVDGIAYKMIGEAEVTNIGAPAEAVCVWDCIKASDKPDEFGCYDLYQMRYNIPESDEDSDAEWYDLIDWEHPYDVVKTQYGWDESQKRMV